MRTIHPTAGTRIAGIRQNLAIAEAKGTLVGWQLQGNMPRPPLDAYVPDRHVRCGRHRPGRDDRHALNVHGQRRADRGRAGVRQPGRIPADPALSDR
jgi:hypothetical protein